MPTSSKQQRRCAALSPLFLRQPPHRSIDITNYHKQQSVRIIVIVVLKPEKLCEHLRGYERGRSWGRALMIGSSVWLRVRRESQPHNVRCWASQAATPSLQDGEVMKSLIFWSRKRRLPRKLDCMWINIRRSDSLIEPLPSTVNTQHHTDVAWP